MVIFNAATNTAPGTALWLEKYPRVIKLAIEDVSSTPPHTGATNARSDLIWGGRGLVALVAGIWALLRRGGDGPDLGTMSRQWLAHHRAHERESDKR